MDQKEESPCKLDQLDIHESLWWLLGKEMVIQRSNHVMAGNVITARKSV